MKPRLFFGRPGLSYRRIPSVRNHVTITKQNAQTLERPTGVIVFESPFPARTLEDMGDAEKARLEREYGCRVGGRFEWGL